MRYLKADLKDFENKLEGLHKAAQKTDRCLRRIEEGAEVFLRK